MIQINLLNQAGSKRAAPKKRRAIRAPALAGAGFNPWFAGLGAAGVLLVLGLAFLFWQTGSRISEIEAQIEEQVADSVRLASTIALVETMRARQDTITNKIAIIQDVDQRRYVWPHLLDEISKAVPAFTWLTGMTSSESADTLSPGPSLTLLGNAGSTQALTRFMKNLEASPHLRDITLVSSEQVSDQGRTFQRFTLEAQYAAPDSGVIETIPVVVVD